MKKKKLINPLIKRIPKELKGDWKKYLVVALFLILTIGFVSGMYVAGNSMMISAEQGISTYCLEDGHLEFDKKPQDEFLKKLKETCNDEGISLEFYENFYKNEEEDKDGDKIAEGTIRVYEKTDKVNLASVLEGRLPQKETEIAIDRMHADNAGIRVGDTIWVSQIPYQVTGLIAYVNYSTLHEKNSDLMFDALKFNVAMVTKAGFERLEGSVHYAYAYRYDKTCQDEIEEKETADKLLKVVAVQTIQWGNEIIDFLPGYANQAIHFATDDMGSDKAMGGVLLDVLIVIIAFIFALTISNTMIKESSAIGTLRAMGYTKGELLRHFLAMPVIVTTLSAIIGNVLGYTLFKDVVVSMYYNSYSLPAYHTVWNTEAFIKTTLIPVILMFVVNLIVIIKMLQHTPLQFLRSDFQKKKRKKAMRLPRWSFFNRFRLRIVFQNLPNYLILLVGIAFIMIMLAMAIGMPSTLQYYQNHVEDMKFANYQYVLKSDQDEQGNPIETKVAGAEKFSMRSLQKTSDQIVEEIALYGVEEDSQYVKIEQLSSLKEKEVYISKSLQEKYGFHIGDAITLEEKYEEKTYTFKVAGIYDKCQTLAVFMPIQNYCKALEMESERFTGYLSEKEIEDIAKEKIATVITERDITKMCDQLQHSMGSYMTYFQYLCILLSAVLIYLLTKIIIEKNENAISMTKILGYETTEIARLYLTTTTIVVVLADVISVIFGVAVMKVLWKQILFSYSGWYAFKMQPMDYVKMFAFVLIGYLLVMCLDFKRIKKIKMDEALKNVE